MDRSVPQWDRAERGGAVIPRRWSGQALVWFTLALPLFLSIAGLAIDGGVLLASRRQLQSVADGAARAGATQLDQGRLRSSGGTDIQLDPELARGSTWTYLNERMGLELDWQTLPSASVDIGARRVHVIIQGALHTAFLRIVHVDSVPVTASAYADIQYCIHSGGGG